MLQPSGSQAEMDTGNLKRCKSSGIHQIPSTGRKAYFEIYRIY
jgi:hypothetical protein